MWGVPTWNIVEFVMSQGIEMYQHLWTKLLSNFGKKLKEFFGMEMAMKGKRNTIFHVI